MRPPTSFAPAFPLARLAFGWVGVLLAVSLPAQPAAPVPVVAVPVHLERVTEILPLTGTVTARQHAALSPRISGLVETVRVDAGAQVKRGDQLVTLDATLAELAAQSADADRVEAETRLAESQRLLEESRRLLTGNSIAETEFMNREAAATIAEASARRATVAHREALERLARHTVVAPFSGVITRKLTEAGEWAATGTPVVELVGLEGARIDVQVPQERLATITAETPVEFALDTAPQKRFPGRITARVPVSNPATRSALVRVEPIDGNPALPPGKSAQVTFHLLSNEPVLAVPRDALVRRADGTVTVWVAQSAGEGWQATARRVDLGRTYSDRIEVLAGLEPGQQVIIRGNETVREGQAIRLVTPTP